MHRHKHMERITLKFKQVGPTERELGGQRFESDDEVNIVDILRMRHNLDSLMIWRFNTIRKKKSSQIPLFV